MQPSKGTLKALDWTNLFMADVKDGVGVYLSVYLLTVRHWEADQIGLVIAVPGLVGIIIQPIAGSVIDRTRYKRLLLSIASIIIAICCFVIIVTKGFYPTFFSQATVGLVQSVYAPCVAAITLGIVGHSQLSNRIGRNESWNHLGNMLAAIVAGVIGRFVSYEAIFWFSIAQCFGLVFAVHFIKEKEIDHELARGADKDNTNAPAAAGLKQLFRSRAIILFTLAMALFHLANGAMLPLVGQKMGLVDERNATLYLSGAIIIAQGVMVFVASFSGRKAGNNRKKILAIAFMLLPVRAVLFAFVDTPFILTAIQLLDGIGAGIFGVVSIIMIADLAKGTGRFNLLQGVVYSAIGLAASLSSIIGGVIVKNLGYSAGFLTLAGIGVLGLLFFLFMVPETKNIKTIASGDRSSTESRKMNTFSIPS
jgi:predicted MFS family arabinose efflux permease